MTLRSRCLSSRPSKSTAAGSCGWRAPLSCRCITITRSAAKTWPSCPITWRHRPGQVWRESRKRWKPQEQPSEMLYTSLCSGRGHGWGTLEERARLSILISLRITISRPRRISLSWNSETPSSSSKSRWWQSWINHSDGGSADPHSPPLRGGECVNAKAPLAPAQVVVLERDGTEAFAGDFEDRVENRRRNLRDRLLAGAGDPAVGLHELNIDLLRILVYAGNWEFVEAPLNSMPVLDCGRLIHGVVITPGDLPFDLLLNRQRIHQGKSLFEDHVHTMQCQLAAFGDLDRMHLGTNRGGRPRRPAAIIDGDAARPALRQRRSPSGHFGHHVEGSHEVIAVHETSDTLLGIGRIAQNQLAPVHVRILACDVRKLVDEAFHVKAIGGGAGASACPDRNVSFRRVNGEAVVRGEVRWRR